MATISSKERNAIDNIYNQQKKSQLDAYDASRKSAINDINAQKTQTNQQFYDARNQSDVVNYQDRQALREMMAAQGLGNSGENISGQVGLSAARQNTLGGLNREEQNVLGSLNRKISDMNDPSERNSIIAQIEAQRAQTLYQAMQRAMDRAEARRRSYGGGGGSRSYSQPAAEPTTQTDLANQMAHKMLESQKLNQSQGRLTPATYTTPWYEKNKNIYGDLYSGF
jgi:hypothetical protein